MIIHLRRLLGGGGSLRAVLCGAAGFENAVVAGPSGIFAVLCA
jgi:hypothetical protein